MTDYEAKARETDYEPDWTRYPKLARVFEHRPTINVYWDDLRQLLRDARADAVRYVRDVKSEEIRSVVAKARKEALEEAARCVEQGLTKQAWKYYADRIRALAGRKEGT